MWKMKLFTSGIWFAIVAVVLGLTGYEVRRERLDRALIAAVAQGDTSRVRTLLAQGADANATELPQRRGSPWQWLLAAGRRSAGHPVPARSALLMAVEGAYYPTFPVHATPDSPDLVAALLRAGADVNARDEAGNPALLYAARNADCTTVSWLLSYDADANTRLADGSTLLMTLIGGGSTDPQILGDIAARSDVNARDSQGRTALMIAVLNGNLAGVRLLLMRHADPVQANRRGENSMSLAYHAYREEPTTVHQQIIQLLREKEASRQAAGSARPPAALRGV